MASFLEQLEHAEILLIRSEASRLKLRAMWRCARFLNYVVSSFLLGHSLFLPTSYFTSAI